MLSIEDGGKVLPFVRMFCGQRSIFLWEDEVGDVHDTPQGEGRTGRSFDAPPLQPRPKRRVGRHTRTVAPWGRQKSGTEAEKNRKHAPHCRLQPGTWTQQQPSGEETQPCQWHCRVWRSWELQWETKHSLCTNWRRRPQPTLHSVLLDRIPPIENVQAAWLLLLFCAAAKANFLLRTVNPKLTFDSAAHHDSRCWQCLCRILRAPDNPIAKMIAAVPLSEEGLGLHSAVLTRSAAHWASWADSIHMIWNRHPAIHRSILTGLSVEFPSAGLQSVRRCGRELQDVGFDLPSWLVWQRGCAQTLQQWKTSLACHGMDGRGSQPPTLKSTLRRTVCCPRWPPQSGLWCDRNLALWFQFPSLPSPLPDSPSLVPNNSAPSFSVASTFPFPYSLLPVWPSFWLPWPPPRSLLRGRDPGEERVPVGERGREGLQGSRSTSPDERHGPRDGPCA